MSITIDRTWRTVHVDGVEKPLTRTQFDFLATLFGHPGYVSHEALDEALHPGDPRTRQHAAEETKVLAHRLRRRLGVDVLLLSRGYGYALKPGAVEEAK